MYVIRSEKCVYAIRTHTYTHLKSNSNWRMCFNERQIKSSNNTHYHYTAKITNRFTKILREWLRFCVILNRLLKYHLMKTNRVRNSGMVTLSSSQNFPVELTLPIHKELNTSCLWKLSLSLIDPTDKLVCWHDSFEVRQTLDSGTVVDFPVQFSLPGLF